MIVGEDVMVGLMVAVDVMVGGSVTVTVSMGAAVFVGGDKTPGRGMPEHACNKITDTIKIYNLRISYLSPL